VTSTQSEAAAAVSIGAGLALRKRDELLGLLRPCFARTAPWLQAGKYVSALASELARVNGWSIARRGGDRTPDRTQRLLNHASWDTFAAMSVVCRFAVAGLEAAARRGRQGGLVIGAIGETGQEKAGEATAGVKRHYLGCAGKVANGITTVHLWCVRDKTGHALTGARQWIPAEHIAGPVKSLLMGLPLDLQFRTKGQLAIDISTMGFEKGKGENEWHFEQFAQYRLLTATKKLAVISHKVGFCIAPTDPVDMLIHSALWQPLFIGLGGACGSPSALWVQEYLPDGWGDTYVQTLAEQAFDITNVPNGTYYIEITANPLHKLHELSTAGNTSLRKIILGGTKGHRTVKVPAWHGIDPEP
jgi:hypothetical protein